MGNTPVTHENASEVASRFLRLYTGAISDILDKNGYRSQVLPYYITPFTTANRVAGMAFTGQGYPCADMAHDDTKTRLKILDSVSPGTVSVWATGGSMSRSRRSQANTSSARRTLTDISQYEETLGSADPGARIQPPRSEPNSRPGGCDGSRGRLAVGEDDARNIQTQKRS